MNTNGRNGQSKMKESKQEITTQKGCYCIGQEEKGSIYKFVGAHGSYRYILYTLKFVSLQDDTTTNTAIKNVALVPIPA